MAFAISSLTKGLAPSKSPLLPVAHLAVLAASNGDPQAKAVIGATLAQANDGAGPADAVATADVFDQAAKLQVRAQFVNYWLFGEGARIVAAATGG